MSESQTKPRLSEKSLDELIAQWREYVGPTRHFAPDSNGDLVCRLIAERDQARLELSHIDDVLARRPALDLPTRRENIEKAISVAKECDQARAELAGAIALNMGLEQNRDDLWRELTAAREELELRRRLDDIDWDFLLQYANPSDGSPRKAREVMNAIDALRQRREPHPEEPK